MPRTARVGCIRAGPYRPILPQPPSYQPLPPPEPLGLRLIQIPAIVRQPLLTSILSSRRFRIPRARKRRQVPRYRDLTFISDLNTHEFHEEETNILHSKKQKDIVSPRFTLLTEEILSKGVYGAL
jgi:hypothetical protein